MLGGYAAGGQGNTRSVNHPTRAECRTALLSSTALHRPSSATACTSHIGTGGFRYRGTHRQCREQTIRRCILRDAENSALITVNVPESWKKQPTEFIAEIESLTIEPDSTAKIVVKQRTGNNHHGQTGPYRARRYYAGQPHRRDQTIQQVSQPNPLSGGTTKVVPHVNTNVTQDNAKNLVLKNGATVEELVQALTSIGSSPRDIISILQNLKTAGALEAELEVI